MTVLRAPGEADGPCPPGNCGAPERNRVHYGRPEQPSLDLECRRRSPEHDFSREASALIDDHGEAHGRGDEHHHEHRHEHDHTLVFV